MTASELVGIHQLALSTGLRVLAINIATGKCQNRVTGPPTFGHYIDLSGYGVSSKSDISSIPSPYSGSNALAPTTEIQELVSTVNTGLDSLLRSSIFVRKYPPKDRHRLAAKTGSLDNLADVRYINDRYPSLSHKSAALAARLGEANARRRQYFKRLRDHNERLSTVATKNYDHEVGTIPEKQSKVVLPKARPAKSVSIAETNSSRPADTEATAFVADAAIHADVEMREAPSTISVASFATPSTEILDKELPFPPMPAEVHTGSPFLCAYCWTDVQLKHENPGEQWRKHILRDLKPYICTFSSCGLDSFHSLHAWFEHELLVHRCQWICLLCSASFMSPENLKGHISKRHYPAISDQQLSTIIDQSKRPVDSIKPNECPFCDGSWIEADTGLTTGEEALVDNLNQFRRHLGHHLQQVALFALPRSIQDHGRSLGSNDVGGFLGRDKMSKTYLWVRDDRGRGWSIISHKRATLFAFAYFLALYRIRSKSPKLNSELNYLWEKQEYPGKVTGISDRAPGYWRQGQCKEGVEELFMQVSEMRRELQGPPPLDTVHSLGLLYRDQGRLVNAEAMYQRVLARREKMHQRGLVFNEKLLGRENPSTLTSMSNLASLLDNQGKYERAEEMHQQALDGYEKLLGKEHPSTLESMNNLASVLGNQGRYEMAEGIYRQALELNEKVFGKEHPSTLTNMSNLALILSRHGKYEAAKEIYQQVLDAYRKVLGEEHPSTLTSMNNLASVLSNQGKYEMAEVMHRQALELREKALGKEHPSTLMSMNNVASVLRIKGKYEMAEEMYQRVLQLNEEVSGKWYLSTLTSMSNLASVLDKQGKYEMAKEMYERAKETCREELKSNETVLGPEHPLTLNTVHSLGLLYQHQKKLAEAEVMYERAQVGKEKSLGQDHPSTLETVHSLGVLYHAQGRFKDAEAKYDWARVGKERSLGRDHPSTLGTINSLGLLYRDQGRFADAEAMYKGALVEKENLLNQDHPSRLDMIHNLGLVYQGQGRPLEAETMYQWALVEKKKSLGRDHPSTLDTIYNLAHVYQDQGKSAESEAMYQWVLAEKESLPSRDHTSTLDTIRNLSLFFQHQSKFLRDLATGDTWETIPDDQGFRFRTISNSPSPSQGETILDNQGFRSRSISKIPNSDQGDTIVVDQGFRSHNRPNNSNSGQGETAPDDQGSRFHMSNSANSGRRVPKSARSTTGDGTRRIVNCKGCRQENAIPVKW
ncbi:hypothetical protein GP486_004323 [Trichoglossum hirsutum]|uniref:C2H2-type domain-containing protein n=1 Tax=Trichoglossum hirsutum TaxID=265104 RepID=A0A9P8LB72_9PEZI|nr:hypothetical protein GP486_004323 [Trichoglossum hirsutum]